ncbi:uncharacterized protein [Ambystoma mexicanum]|uniref:uncharacterized protein n=1 Tax=Ambystoma mexicanum TaxID=8296 RepID=UPI0037E74D77
MDRILPVEVWTESSTPAKTPEATHIDKMPEAATEAAAGNQEPKMPAITLNATPPKNEPAQPVHLPYLQEDPKQPTEVDASSSNASNVDALERVIKQLEELIRIRQSVAAATSAGNSKGSINNLACLNATLNALKALNQQFTNGQEEMSECLQTISEMLKTMHNISIAGGIGFPEDNPEGNLPHSAPELLERLFRKPGNYSSNERLDRKRSKRQGGRQRF